MNGSDRTPECALCDHYADVRRPVLIPAMAARRAVTGETALQITRRYFSGVHARHLAGLPIMPGAAS